MQNSHREELDRILDEGLTTYASPEPWPGLEERVLSRLRDRMASRKPDFLRWAFLAIPVAACLLFAIAAFQVRQDTRPAPAVAVTRSQISGAMPQTAAPGQPVERRTIARKSVAKAVRLPKRAQFPTATPLSSEERALLELIMRAPQEARALLAEPDPSRTAAIQIQPIQIEPLESGARSEDNLP